MKFIFVSGGVVSGLGKGITTASVCMLLKNRGYSVAPLKVDMYMNIDSGTLRPSEHGEVFVTDDGIETDQDVGNYERFLNCSLTRENYCTLGQIFQEVIRKERSLEYDGATVDFIPHVTDEIIRRYKLAAKAEDDIVVIELGGTVGEYKNAIFYEAARILKMQQPKDVSFLHVVYVPYLTHIGELKTKPAQESVHTLNRFGIQPDFLVVRAEKVLDKPRLSRLSLFCNVEPESIISNPDVDSIYQLPMLLESQGLSDKILKFFGLSGRVADIKEWEKFYVNLTNTKESIKIGLVGKYFAIGDYVLSDAYISVIEAIRHASSYIKTNVEQVWINAEEVFQNGLGILDGLDGIVVPQGWGSRGAEGKIKAIQFARETKLPYLGLCYGMQMAVIEFARNVLGWSDANSEEVDPQSEHPVIHIMPNQKEYLANKQYGGTIRLGAWPCVVDKESLLFKAYSEHPGHFADSSVLEEKWKGSFQNSTDNIIVERHRHRYEFNNKFINQFKEKGFVISGTSPDGKLVESIELHDHPFFIGTQFHPELKSRPLDPHPIFITFIKKILESKV